MIRLFIFTFVRFIIIALAIYAALTFIKYIIRLLKGHTQTSKRYPNQQQPQKSKEHYTDVKDAKFVELPDERKQDNQKHSD